MDLTLGSIFFTKKVLKHWHRFPGDVVGAQARGYCAKGTWILAGGGLELEQKLSTRAAFEAQSSQKLERKPRTLLSFLCTPAVPVGSTSLPQVLSLPPKQSSKELMQTNFQITRASPAQEAVRKLCRELPG